MVATIYIEFAGGPDKESETAVKIVEFLERLKGENRISDLDLGQILRAIRSRGEALK